MGSYPGHQTWYLIAVALSRLACNKAFKAGLAEAQGAQEACVNSSTRILRCVWLTACKPINKTIISLNVFFMGLGFFVY